MQFPLLCTSCLDQELSADESFVFVTINDSGIYEITCARGHRTTVVVSGLRYQQLFEIGLSAILDGYFREAVSSFASSLERFYQFAVGVFAQYVSVAEVKFTDAWRLLSRQSERQLGAFILAYLLAEGSPPTLLKQEQVKFRNEVVHNGKIPTREEALSYGDAVLNEIRTTLIVLRSKYRHALDAHTKGLTLSLLQSPSLRGKKVSLYDNSMTLRVCNVCVSYT